MGFLVTIAVIGLPGVIGATVLRQGGSPTQSSWVMLICSAVVGLGFGTVAAISADASDAGGGIMFVVVTLFIGGIACTLGMLMRAITWRRMH